MKSKLQVAVIVIAMIWAVVILATSTTLEGAPHSSRVLTILGGAAASIILLGGMIVPERKAQ
jgi:hypothetical protein